MLGSGQLAWLLGFTESLSPSTRPTEESASRHTNTGRGDVVKLATREDSSRGPPDEEGD